TPERAVAGGPRAARRLSRRPRRPGVGAPDGAGSRPRRSGLVTRVKHAAGDTFRSLRSRNFRLFFGGQLISQVGNWLTMIAQTLLVLSLTGNGLAVGLLVGCQFFPVLAFGAFTGLIADRSDKRKLLLIVQVFAMAQSFTLAAL